MEETAGRIRLGTGLAVRGFSETIGLETMELVHRQMADSMGRVSIGAFGYVVDTG